MSDAYSSGSATSDNKSPPRAAGEAIETVSSGIKTAIESGRKPDMPLGIVSSLTREAPLPALMIAFLLSVLVARRG
jgi:hypothetical protein